MRYKDHGHFLIMNNRLKYITLFFLLILFLKGAIFRSLIKYESIGSRDIFEITNKRLISKIEGFTSGQELNIEELISASLKVTSSELSFTFDEVGSNPNIIVEHKKANCIGYSALFNSILTYVLKENNLATQFQVSHKIGSLSLLGINVHSFFASPFFRDHDYNEILEIETGKVISVDPTVYDYLWIREVAIDD